MSYKLVILRHSGPCVVNSPNSTSQYGGPMVAATALPKGHFVGPYGALGHLTTSGLPLPAPGPKPLVAATRACSQDHFHRQFAAPTHSGGPSPLPPPGPAREPRSDGGIGALAGAISLSWLRRPKALCNASYPTVPTVMLAPNWLKLITYWCLHWQRQVL